MPEVDRKVDDLEGRSKRNNLLIHGLVRAEKETGEDCEGVLRDPTKDRLDRNWLMISSLTECTASMPVKPNSPVVARCSFSKTK